MKEEEAVTLLELLAQNEVAAGTEEGAEAGEQSQGNITRCKHLMAKEPYFLAHVLLFRARFF